MLALDGAIVFQTKLIWKSKLTAKFSILLAELYTHFCLFYIDRLLSSPSMYCTVDQLCSVPTLGESF